MHQVEQKSILNKTILGYDHQELKDYEGYLLHQDIIASFQRLRANAKTEIRADLKIISSYRNFERQKVIWNEKAQGTRKVLDDHGNIVTRESLSDRDFLLKIMRFSAVPGMSRHHWGTDIDIFDANKLAKNKVQLTPNECIGEGPFATLHTWLDQKISSHESYGFFRPYEQDLGGVSPEKWHLSYAPVAQKFFRQLTIDLFIQCLEENEIAFKDILLSDPQFYFDKYVKSISLP